MNQKQQLMHNQQMETTQPMERTLATNTNTFTLRNSPKKTDMYEDFALCCQTSRNQEEPQYWRRMTTYTQMLRETEGEISNMLAGQGSGGGASGGGAPQGGDSGFWELLKKLLQMIKDILEIVSKSVRDHAIMWKSILDIIIKFLPIIVPSYAGLLDRFGQNYELVMDLLVKYFKDNQYPSINDLFKFILLNIKGGTFEPVLEIYKSIMDRQLRQVIQGSFNLALNVFAFMYGGVLLGFVVSAAKASIDMAVNGPSGGNQAECVKALSLLVLTVSFNELKDGTDRKMCTLL